MNKRLIQPFVWLNLSSQLIVHHDKFSTQTIVSTLLDIVYKIIDIYLFLVSNLIKSTAEY